jgi:hypothetical protein
MKGCGWEIYTTSLSPLFTGSKFTELSFMLYDKFGVVLFALQITDLASQQSKVVLNPLDYEIPDQEKFRIEAFVIATNKASSDLSFQQNDRQSLLNVNISSLTSMVKQSIDYRSGAYVEGDHRRRRSRQHMNKVEPLSSVHSDMSALADQAAAFESSAADELDSELPKKSHWASLRRSSLLRKKIEIYSYQEILHRLEDKHFNENYYLRPMLLELSECTVKTGVLEELPYIHNHLIVIGKNLKNLYDLIKPLRAKYLGALRYIIIVHPEDIPHDVWQRIAVFDGVLFVRGSPLEENHLRRAGIFRASQVVVLADGSQASATTGMEALVDSDAIFAYQHVRRMNPNTQVVLEIVNQTNIAYLEVDQNNQAMSNDYKFSSQFAAGILFTTSLLDSIVCQVSRGCSRYYAFPSLMKYFGIGLLQSSNH